MAKLIFIIVVTLLLVLWFKHMGRRRDQGEQKPDRKSGAAEDMVRCQVCGVNLPRSEALLSRGRFYCCEPHRQKDQN